MSASLHLRCCPLIDFSSSWLPHNFLYIDGATLQLNNYTSWERHNWTLRVTRFGPHERIANAPEEKATIHRSSVVRICPKDPFRNGVVMKNKRRWKAVAKKNFIQVIIG